MTINGSCHCGAVRVSVPGEPKWLGACNCSLCRKTGNLMAYYPDDGSVKVEGETATYIWGDKMIANHFCKTCACRTHWTSTGTSHGKIGVNARLLDGFEVREGDVGGGDGAKDGDTVEYAIGGKPVAVRFLDNA
ncbi:MAG: GFA family protein [Sphingomicrobium sp.]